MTGTLADPRLLQAVIAGLFVAAGWVYNGWRNRRDAARLREERIRDVHRALFAEIGAYLDSIGSLEALQEGHDRIARRMHDEPDFLPFHPTEEPDRVYRAIIGEIHILPRTSIDVVVAFYGQIAAIGAFIEDMRSERFAAISQARRIAIYDDYIRLKMRAFQYGNAALALIDDYSKGGRPAAELRLRDLREAGLVTLGTRTGTARDRDRRIGKRLRGQRLGWALGVAHHFTSRLDNAASAGDFQPAVIRLRDDARAAPAGASASCRSNGRSRARPTGTACAALPPRPCP